MCICAYIHTDIYVFMHTYILVHTYIHTYIRTYMRKYMCVCRYTYVEHTYACIYIYTYLYVHTYIRICIHILCTRIYRHTQSTAVEIPGVKMLLNLVVTSFASPPLPTPHPLTEEHKWFTFIGFARYPLSKNELSGNHPCLLSPRFRSRVGLVWSDMVLCKRKDFVEPM